MTNFDWFNPVKGGTLSFTNFDELVETQATECQTFILGGIKAVKNAPTALHAHIIADMAAALGCCDEALSFLVQTDPTTQNSDLDFPDSERRRQIAANNHLFVAE